MEQSIHLCVGPVVNLVNCGISFTIFHFLQVLGSGIPISISGQVLGQATHTWALVTVAQLAVLVVARKLMGQWPELFRLSWLFRCCGFG